MMIPITVILTRHQQRMAGIMRQDMMNPHQNQEMLAVQYEVQQLKSMVASIAMDVDDLKNEVRSQSNLQDRVKVKE